MRFMLALLALANVALASPGFPVLNPGGIGGIFKGPNSEIIIKGPDGSVLIAAAEGGEVHTNLSPIVAAEEVPVIVSSTLAPEIIEVAAPVIVEAPIAPVPVETVIVDAPEKEPEPSADLIGPSGRISTQGSKAVIAGPASTTISGPAVLAQTVVKGPPIIGPIAEIPIETIAPVQSSPVIALNQPTFLPVSSTILPPVSSTYLPEISSTILDKGLTGPGLVEVNDRIDLTGPRIGVQYPIDQLAIDNRQLQLNPPLISPANIFPPEIGINGKLDDAALVSSTSAPILLQETVSVTPKPYPGVEAGRIPYNGYLGPTSSPVGLQETVSVTPKPYPGVEAERIIYSGYLGPTSSPVGLQETVSVTPKPYPGVEVGRIPYNGYLGPTSSPVGLQETPNVQRIEDTRILADGYLGNTADIKPVNEVYLPENNLLGKTAAEGGQIQLTNIPLSAVNALPRNGLVAEAWRRTGRNANEKKS